MLAGALRGVAVGVDKGPCVNHENCHGEGWGVGQGSWARYVQQIDTVAFHVRVTQGDKIRDEKLFGTSDEAKFRYASIWLAGSQFQHEKPG